MKKLRTNHQNSNKVRLAMIVLLVVLAVVTYGLVAHAVNVWPFEKAPITQTKPMSNQNQPSQQDNVDAKSQAQSTDGSSKTTDQIPVDSGLKAHIDSLGESNGVVSFAGSVSGASEDGQCSVTFSNPNDRPVTKTVDADISGSVATCKSVSISANNFSYLGEWSVTFRYFTSTSQAITNGTIQIQ